MRAFVVLFALAAVAAAAPSSDHMLQAVFRAKFNTYLAKHGKTYAAHEEPERLQNFLTSTHHIETHNERYAKGLETYFLEHNVHSDMSMEEYVKNRLGVVRPTGLEAEANVTIFKPSANFVALERLDWRDHKIVTPVKNQGQCGSCYTFSTTGALEGQFARKHGYLVSFSEQQLVDCSKPYHGNWGGCVGGWMHDCYKYMKESGVGTNSERDYPYEGKLSSCRTKSGQYARVKDFVRLPYNNEKALEEALTYVGPISVAYDASNREFMLYGGGIFDSPNCNKDRTTHAVVAVGYGSENGIRYWIVKNSWGDQWGEQGYFRMRRDINDRCGIASWASYPILS